MAPKKTTKKAPITPEEWEDLKLYLLDVGDEKTLQLCRELDGFDEALDELEEALDGDV